MNQLSSLAKRFTAVLMDLDNVVGVGWGHREVSGTLTLEPCLVVLVTRKMDRASLARGQAIPSTLGNARTDVVEVGDLRLLSARRTRTRPAPGGVSIGHHNVSAGTLGCIVRDRKTGRRLILSNNHVLANISDGSDGRASPGDAILQPGAYDGGGKDDIIGRLERFVPLYRLLEAPECPWARLAEKTLGRMLRMVSPSHRLSISRLTARENLVDAAVARPLSDDDLSDEIIDIGTVWGIDTAEPGMEVRKSGRSSGLTTGVVRAVDATLRVHLGDVGPATFRGQIVTTPMASPGDSGSLLVTTDGRAVGLLFAGSETATIHSPIGTVLDQLDVTLDGAVNKRQSQRKD